MGTIRTVRISVTERALRKLPHHVVNALMRWVEAVEADGLQETRKVPGFHDEPLKGKRRGQRSIRLSKAYRAIYVVTEDGAAEIADVVEVNKHKY